jgi:hypothetical protein
MARIYEFLTGAENRWEWYNRTHYVNMFVLNVEIRREYEELETAITRTGAVVCDKEKLIKTVYGNVKKKYKFLERANG